MTIKEFLLRAIACDPITESAVQRILQRILKMLGFNAPKGLPEPKERDP